MSALLKILPLAAGVGVAAMNADALKKSLGVVDKVRGAATSGIEMQGIAEALAGDFVESRDLPIENFGAWLKENMREKGGKETRDKSKDPWGTDYRLTVDVAKNGFSVLSAGPDKNWKTEDDLTYFYSLSGIDGKNAISRELAARAQAQAARQGTTASSASSAGAGRGPAPGTRPAAAASGKSSAPPKPSQSAEETTRKVIEAQTKRAESGDAQASFDLANRYITENGVVKDYNEAKKLLEQAVKNADSATLREKAQTQLDNLNKALKQ